MSKLTVKTAYIFATVRRMRYDGFSDMAGTNGKKKTGINIIKFLMLFLMRDIKV
jgi:hypothetical protein